MIFITSTDEAKKNCVAHILSLQGLWKIQISPVKRSKQQNAYFHSVLALIAPHTPFPAGDLKEILKADFLGVREYIWQGKKYAMPIPSSSLDTKQYSLLLEKLLALAGELNVEIPGRDYFGY